MSSRRPKVCLPYIHAAWLPDVCPGVSEVPQESIRWKEAEDAAAYSWRVFHRAFQTDIATQAKVRELDAPPRCDGSSPHFVLRLAISVSC